MGAGRMTAWSVIHQGGRTLVSPARGPARWDVTVPRHLPSHTTTPRLRARLATQVRQDVWRAIARVPGFVPLVSVEAGPGGLCLTAGGCLRAPTGHRPTIAAAIAAVLDAAANRTRWLAYAGSRLHQEKKPCSIRS